MQDEVKGTYTEILQESGFMPQDAEHQALLKYDETTGKPATVFQLYQLAEKLNRKYSTAFEAREFKAKVQKQLRKSA